MEYHDLNSTFKYDGKVLKVVSYTKCENCYFGKLGISGFNCDGNACMIDSRKDKESAMFIE